MDALFIDEGFGTLSDDALDRALEALNALTEGERLVGIISHVDRLNESIPQKICVRSGEKGSSLTLEIP
jgi:exonuclease SbcC